jgi:hypothetical protein
MPIEIVDKKISHEEIKKMAQDNYGDMVKAVVDVERKIMAIGGEFHADAEQVLLEQGSKQTDLWGINIFPDLPAEKFIVFDSMINIKPAQNNRTRGIQDENVRHLITKIVYELCT